MHTPRHPLRSQRQTPTGQVILDLLWKLLTAGDQPLKDAAGVVPLLHLQQVGHIFGTVAGDGGLIVTRIREHSASVGKRVSIRLPSSYPLEKD